jgi:hypothetical protein
MLGTVCVENPVGEAHASLASRDYYIPGME